MRKLRLVIFSLLTVNYSLLTYPGFAEDCLQYKTIPSLEIKVPSHFVSIVKPDRRMDLLHGNVVSTFSEEYEIEYGAERINAGGLPPEAKGEGWCIFIENITAIIGYTDFVVQIDKRHSFDSCEFKGILEHEEEHIRAHLSVVEDEQKDILRAIQDAANNVLPVFVKDESGFDSAMNDIEDMLQKRPEIRLLRQKLAAEQEIRNKKIDLIDKGHRVKACGD